MTSCLTQICNNLLSCFGFCPYFSLEYEEQIRAPDGTYLPVDQDRQTTSKSIFRLNQEEHKSSSDVLRIKVYLIGISLTENHWLAVEGVDYEKHGFVYTSIGYVPLGSDLSKKYINSGIHKHFGELLSVIHWGKEKED